MRYVCALFGRLAIRLTMIQITQVKIISDRDGKPKGFGYVEFATVDGLKVGLTKHGMVSLSSVLFFSFGIVDHCQQNFSNRQIRVNVAEPRTSILSPKIRTSSNTHTEKEREGGFGRNDDEKFASPWRREGPLPVRDDAGAGGPRRRYDNIAGPGGEPREPSASDNNSDWRSNRAPPRIPSESDMPPRRKGSGFSTPQHEGEPSPADAEEVWAKGSKFKPSPSAENQSGGKFGSMRGRPEGGQSPVLPSPADDGPWRRARPAGSTSRM